MDIIGSLRSYDELRRAGMISRKEFEELKISAFESEDRTDDPYTLIQQYEQLCGEGILSKEEFAERRAQIMRNASGQPIRRPTYAGVTQASNVTQMEQPTRTSRKQAREQERKMRKAQNVSPSYGQSTSQSRANRFEQNLETAIQKRREERTSNASELRTIDIPTNAATPRPSKAAVRSYSGKKSNPMGCLVLLIILTLFISVISTVIGSLSDDFSSDDWGDWEDNVDYDMFVGDWYKAGDDDPYLTVADDEVVVANTDSDYLNWETTESGLHVYSDEDDFDQEYRITADDSDAIEIYENEEVVGRLDRY